ncbi:helix-turn-helix domain-containing protein [Bythopirellula goksoeyrii]|uniref:Helix-turn-helix domain protein n=1 Tax=Bythopirellula goksoeyrii TaxID=1400387 RepID=A0A5B9QC09_9BACT|nr:helix-turn-helix domain-containing protein [Bythopirellula goksoeyrii]QEG35115.1 Helix-turn-helix domain protein [Bythopirellula goksoeyrii]
MSISIESSSIEQQSIPSALLNEHQVCRYLGNVSAKHLYNLRKRGDLPFVSVGRRILYSRIALDRWIEERQQQSK